MALGSEFCPSRLWQVLSQSGSRQARFISLIAKKEKIDEMQGAFRIINRRCLNEKRIDYTKKGCQFWHPFQDFSNCKRRNYFITVDFAPAGFGLVLLRGPSISGKRPAPPDFMIRPRLGSLTSFIASLAPNS